MRSAHFKCAQFFLDVAGRCNSPFIVDLISHKKSRCTFRAVKKEDLLEVWTSVRSLEETCSTHMSESDRVQSLLRRTVSKLQHEIHLDELQAELPHQKTEADGDAIRQIAVLLESGLRRVEVLPTEQRLESRSLNDIVSG